jgi:hypothetical protein
VADAGPELYTMAYSGPPSGKVVMFSNSQHIYVPPRREYGNKKSGRSAQKGYQVCQTMTENGTWSPGKLDSRRPAENQFAESHPTSAPALYNEHLHDILLEFSASNL